MGIDPSVSQLTISIAQYVLQDILACAKSAQIKL